MIHAQQLVRSYEVGGHVVRALDGVSLRISVGELVAIRGPSGSGKSTLMNVIGCLDRPDSGRYVLAGEDVSTLEDDELAEVRNRRIGFVFQTFNLLPRLTALENVELPVLYGSGADARRRAVIALEQVGLADRMYHEPTQLSGGERQRVAIARALVNDPAIILADEPTGALDTRTGEDVLAVLRDLNAQGRTILIVTHDVSVARQCPREIFLRDGRIDLSPQEGKPIEQSIGARS